MKTILAVDDSGTMRELIEFVLSSAGFRVVLAHDGLDALVQLGECKPDIIITDMNMPRMDGLRFIKHARSLEAGRSTPIVVLSSETDLDKQALARSYGAADWLSKPFNPIHLLQTVQRLTATRASVAA